MIFAEPWPYPLIEIEWADAETDDTQWTNIEGYVPRLPLIRTVGWLVSENEELYLVSSTLSTKWQDGDKRSIDTMGQLFKIPKGMVRQMRQIEPPSAFWKNVEVETNEKRGVIIERD